MLGGCTIFKGKLLTIIICCFSLSKTAFAKDVPVLQLTLKPNICVLSEAESHCEDILVAEWKATMNKKISLCLFQRNNAIPIECWNDVSFGSTTFRKSIAATTMFELRDASNQTLLSEQVFKVINSQKKIQRSRRNPWSFF